MESPLSQPQGTDAETPGQKQARLRRERREAKLKAEGTSRLQKITNVSGRQNLPGKPLWPAYCTQHCFQILPLSSKTPSTKGASHARPATESWCGPQ